MTEQNAQHLDASAESFTQWPEAVREYENGKALERSDYDLVELADAAIAALKAEVERLKDINKRLDWMMEEAALLLTERGVYVSLQEAIADLATRYEKEHGND